MNFYIAIKRPNFQKSIVDILNKPTLKDNAKYAGQK